MTSADEDSTCVRLEYWGNSPYGYDYIPNSRCLEIFSDGESEETGIRLCHIYLESEEEDIFFTRQANGDTSVYCNEFSLFDASTFEFYQASDLPVVWPTVHEDTWPYPGYDDTDGLIDLRRCDNFTEFLELADYTADVCSHMGEPMDSSSPTLLTTAHESLHTLPKLHGKTIPSPEPGVAPSHQDYMILAGDIILTNNKTGRCTAGPQLTWTENGRYIYGMVVPSHCVQKTGVGGVVYKKGRGFAAFPGYDFTRHIGEVVAISEEHDMALVSYYWTDCPNKYDCVTYTIRGSATMRAKTGSIFGNLSLLNSTYNWNPLEISEFETFKGFGAESNTNFSGDFTLDDPYHVNETGSLVAATATDKTSNGDSGGPIWYSLEDDGILMSNSIAGMYTSTIDWEEMEPEDGRDLEYGFIRGDTILSWTKWVLGFTTKFVTLGGI